VRYRSIIVDRPSTWTRLRWRLSRSPECGCARCDPPWRVGFYRMYVCQLCGDKRCWGAQNHRRATCVKEA